MLACSALYLLFFACSQGPRDRSARSEPRSARATCCCVSYAPFKSPPPPQATRKPTSLQEKFGAFELRAVVRRFENRDFQLPPRYTRLLPDVPPRGFRFGVPANGR